MARVDMKHATQLEKDFDNVMYPELLASTGGILRQFTDWRDIKGETRVITKKGASNYSNTAPYAFDRTWLADPANNLTGGTRTIEIAPHYVYGYEVLTAEEKNSLNGRVTGNEWFISSLREALEFAEDFEILQALEDADALMPAENKLGDATKPIYHPDMLRQFKALLVYANGRFKGKRMKANLGAFCIIHSLDWAKVVLENGQNAIFADSDFKHMTGVTGLSVQTVCGVAIVEVDDLERGYGATNRNYYVKQGTVRLCVYKNIAGVSWQNSIRTEVADKLLNGNTLVLGVSKSVGAKVVDPKGCWLFTCKPEKLNEFTQVDLGTAGNPMVTTGAVSGASVVTASAKAKK